VLIQMPAGQRRHVLASEAYADMESRLAALHSRQPDPHLVAQAQDPARMLKSQHLLTGVRAEGDPVPDGRRPQRPQRARLATCDVVLGQGGPAHLLHPHATAREQLHQPGEDRLRQRMQLVVGGRSRFDELGRANGAAPALAARGPNGSPASSVVATETPSARSTARRTTADTWTRSACARAAGSAPLRPTCHHPKRLARRSSRPEHAWHRLFRRPGSGRGGWPG
jgi:hypothetical protein